MLQIVGMGQLFESLPLRAVDALSEADQIILQTASGSCAQDVLARYSSVASIDDVYEAAQDFDQLYALGAEAVLRYARESDRTCFCCLGLPETNGFVKELQHRTPIVVAGQTDPAAEAVYLTGGIIRIADYASFEARTIKEQYINSSNGVVVTGVDDRYTASEVKIALSEYYPDAHQAALVLDGNVRTTAIDQIDRIEDWTPSGVLVVGPLRFEEKERFTFMDTLTVMQKLRARDGCPWDREQTHESLRPYLIEEAYEVSDAVAEGDMSALADELGDVLLQVIFHAQMGKEAGEFNDIDVTTALCEKMIRRHPHVFGDVVAATSEEVLDNWEQIKREEKGEDGRRSALDGVPDSMDPLSRALKLQQKAARVGFDWEGPEGAIEKTEEELGEFAEEVRADAKTEVSEEGGDLLFAAVNALRKAGVDPRTALQDACRKFTRRFRYIEKHAERTLEDMTLADMDKLWNEAKASEPKQHQREEGPLGE